MIDLYSADTPNGKKITIMLEEINFEYKIIKVDLNKNEQFSSKFKKISPFNKIPVIVDHNNKESVFESGAILMYLGEKSKKFYDESNKIKINQWLIAQMAYIGPMIGQHHQFHFYNKGKSEFGEKRYFDIVKKIYQDLDERLSENSFLAGKNYSIADIATWPWIARHRIHDIGLSNYSNLSRWYNEISVRPAVIKGFKSMNQSNEIDSP